MEEAPSRKRRSRNRFSTIPLLPQPCVTTVEPEYFRQQASSGRRSLVLEEEEPADNLIHLRSAEFQDYVDLGALIEEDEAPEENSMRAFDIDLNSAECQDDDDDTELQCTSEICVKIPTWRVLWGLVITNGGRKITKDQYQSIRVLTDTFSRMRLGTWLAETEKLQPPSSGKKNIFSLPHYTTLHTVFKPMLFKFLAPRSRSFLETIDMKKAGARCNSHSASGEPQTALRVIFPSEYARADVTTGPTFEAMRSTSLEHFKARGSTSTAYSNSFSDCIDLWPLIAARRWFYGPTQSISVDESTSSARNASFCETGDVINVSLVGSEPLSLGLHQTFGVDRGPDGHFLLQGIVLHTWTVHHKRRKKSADFSSGDTSKLEKRDKAIVAALNYVSYCSPTDSVEIEVPDVPEQNDNDGAEPVHDPDHSGGLRLKKRVSSQTAISTKLRRSAMKRRNQEMAAAWARWKKPLLKPGDVVTMLHAYRTDPISPLDNRARVFVVNRFWTENDERSRHIFWIPSNIECDGERDADISMLVYCAATSTISPDLHRDVNSITMIHTHPGERGPERFAPVSSMGTLESGEKYFIYRFLLFWDGFEISAGKSASGEGFYLMCLNFPNQARASSNAVRVISLTPPGVKFEVVFRRILEDIIKGMTEGFLEIDATGETRRVFLDLVGVIGDTPALNAALDVLGHTGNACCHLCRFVRGASTLVGSRYSAKSAHGFVSAQGRTFYQHTAVRDCDAKRETCRLLGMKPIQANSALPLHSVRAAMLEARSNIPKTARGVPILTGDLDPYRACLVAPDHLLTGHARDLMNLAFKLLPSKKHCAACEGFMLGFLTACGLKTQNRLLDHEKRSLYTMSMTDMYALILVAELGFIKGCDEIDSTEESGTTLSEKCRTAIALIGSFSTIIAALWMLPTTERDGRRAVESFEEDNGQSNIRRVQHLMMQHIAQVQAQCTMDDINFNAMEDNQCDRAQRAQLTNEYKSCLAAIKIVDKPNVHRLLELVSTTLPMVGHVSRIGELVLEKTHQVLKRAINLSNKKDIQVTSMKSIAISDWQGRLTMVAQDALLGDANALRCCFRLLAGRESIFALGGRLQPAHISQVLRAIGPASCVPQELKSQAKTVLSPRATNVHGFSWKIEGNIERALSREFLSTEERRNTFDCILNAYQFDMQEYSIEMGDSVSCNLRNGLPGPRFRRGDIVQTLCFNPMDLDSHFPFIMQAGLFNTPQHFAPHCANMFWCICTIFTVTRLSGMPQYFASVLPCVQAQSSMGNTSTAAHDLYKVHTVPSLGDNQYYLAKLHTNMLKIGAIHNCTPGQCEIHYATATVTHAENANPLQGGTFYALSRKHGFPPRNG